MPRACDLFLKRKFSHYWPFNNRHLNNCGFRHFNFFAVPLRLVGVSKRRLRECVRCDGQSDNRS
jgi:hypothetical protein